MREEALEKKDLYRRYPLLLRPLHVGVALEGGVSLVVGVHGATGDVVVRQQVRVGEDLVWEKYI